MMAKSGAAVGKPELLEGPCGPPWDHLENHRCVLSSWAPLGFSCPYFIDYMGLTVFINIVTPNGLLNSLIFSFFL